MASVHQTVEYFSHEMNINDYIAFILGQSNSSVIKTVAWREFLIKKGMGKEE